MLRPPLMAHEWLMRPILLGVLAAALLGTDANSDNTVLAACKRWGVENKFVPEDLAEAHSNGECWGIIRTLGHVSELLQPKHRSCPPPDVNYGQIMRVIVAYIERRPQRLENEHFYVLGIEAMREAWPCKKR
jgi:hypothetical protein